MVALAGSAIAQRADAVAAQLSRSRISASWRPLLDQRIRELEAVRDNLESCIGCGCLSMRQCTLFNPQDELGASASGPRRKVPILDDDEQ